MLCAPQRALPSPAGALAWRLGDLVTVLAATCLVLVAGCDDDDGSGPTGPDEDTIAPRVVSVAPIVDDTVVAAETDVVVVSDEGMDPASARGDGALSSGGVTGLIWDDARTLRIEHTTWSSAVRIGITVTTGLTDAARNRLSVDQTFEFWPVAGNEGSGAKARR